jgi:hypothetical protein
MFDTSVCIYNIIFLKDRYHVENLIRVKLSEEMLSGSERDFRNEDGD